MAATKRVTKNAAVAAVALNVLVDQPVPESVSVPAGKKAAKLPTSADQYHVDVYAAVSSYESTIGKAVTTMAARLESLISARYGKVAPTFEQFQADRKALAGIAKAKGLASDQWVRKPYNKAIIALYSALPVSMSASSVAMRAKRAASPKSVSVKVKAGKPVGTVDTRKANDKESIQQYIARVGIFAILNECVKILDAVPATKKEAQALKTIAGAAQQAA